MRLKPLNIIKTKDIMVMLACSQQTAYRKMRAIKEHYHKSPKGVVTLEEFKEYFGLRGEVI